MPGLSFIIILVIIIALGFDVINGFHDTANSIATCVSTRALPPRIAITMAAVLNFIGALVSEGVAKTISNGLVSGSIEQYVIASSLLAAIVWNLITWWFGMPSSSSHALIGGLVGSAIAFSGGFNTVIWKGLLEKVVIPLVASPIIGFTLGYIVMSLLNFLMKPFANRKVNSVFSKLQIASAAFMSYAHGSNDAQKSMGIITLALVNAGLLNKTSGIPIWVKLLCALAMALGTSLGGRKIIKTIGMNMISLQPVNGFAADMTSAVVIETATAMGAPLSTTHVISSSIMGVGATKRLSAVRWGIAVNIVRAWVFTIPSTAVLGALFTEAIKLIIK